MSYYSVGILVVSDSCFRNETKDSSGVNLKEIINTYVEQDKCLYKSEFYSIVPDDISEIKKKLIEWSDNLKINLILTTGGTGFSPRDLTPEATRDVIEKEASSITHTILIESLKITKFAMLSRAISGIRKSTLIINLPGSKKGSEESLRIILPTLKHALDLVNESRSNIRNDHSKIQNESSNYYQHNHHHCNFHDKNLQSLVSDKDIKIRPRKSPYPMLTVDEAINVILSNTDLTETENVYYLDSLNRITAESVFANDALPPFAASVKDGFAIKLNEKQLAKINKTVTEKCDFVFSVIGSSNAGDNMNIELKQGECIKINTGAPVPLNADAIVQIEDTISIEKNDTGEDSKIMIIETNTCGGDESNEINIRLGQDIRPIGFDIKNGEEVVKKHTLIKPAQIGICATVGSLSLKVYKIPIVGLVSTGNELRNPDDTKLSNFKIRDSNKSLLYAALKSFGIPNIYDAGIANDDTDSILKIFKKALDNSDVIISTGGVSMGDKDLVKDVLEKDLNCKIHFARMNMKPGKPTTFATCSYNGKKKLIFCLPGNPVSAIVTFNLVVIPCLKKKLGYLDPYFTEIKVKCEFETLLDPRPEYHRCKLIWPELTKSTNVTEEVYPKALSTGNQHSSRLLSMNDANCLVKLPSRTNVKTTVCKGEILSALLIDKI